MQIRVAGRERGNVFVGVFVLVVGAVVVWKLYVTAKTLLPDTPLAPPPPTASNSVPTNIPPNVTINANWFEFDDAAPTVPAPQSAVAVVYGLEHTNHTPWGTLTGQPVPEIAAMSPPMEAGGDLQSLTDSIRTYGLAQGVQSTVFNGTDWVQARFNGPPGLITIPALWGSDSGGASGFYLTTLQRSTNGTNWTNLASQWMHGGTFSLYVDTDGLPTALYRAVMDEPVINPAVR